MSPENMINLLIAVGVLLAVFNPRVTIATALWLIFGEGGDW